MMAFSRPYGRESGGSSMVQGKRWAGALLTCVVCLGLGAAAVAGWLVTIYGVIVSVGGSRP